MTKEESIKVLTQYIDYDAETPDYYEMEKACKVAIKALEQEPRWIPVSERLPEKSGYYLTSIGDLVATYPFDGSDFRLRDNTCVIYVDAWMPLPEPYKAEKE